MRLILLVLVSLTSVSALSAKLDVIDLGRSYALKAIYGERVKGVEISFKTEIERKDCNRWSFNVTPALVEGEGKGFADKYFFDGRMFRTEMYCPLEKPVKETIYSEKFFIKSFTNPYAKGVVRIEVVVPVGSEMIVREIN